MTLLQQGGTAMARNYDVETYQSFKETAETELQYELESILHLTPNEARIYLAMLNDNLYTASELSAITRIHRSRIYDNLRGLEAKKLIICVNLEPLKFTSLPPHDAIAQILQNLNDKHREQIQAVSTLGVLLEAMRSSKNKNRDSMSSYTSSLTEILPELKERLALAKTRVWVSKKASGGIIDWFTLQPDLDELVRLGVDIRFLSSSPIHLKYSSKHNPQVTLSFSLVDDFAITFLFSESDSDDSRIMITNNHDYVRFLEQNFIDWWEMDSV
jgi:sugar-specific transcriptional regulator TrmB